uniref:Uncharacterized protein n=1 Tax=Oryza sativa subsp. japonica TaxID=39947 RepID=Q6ZAH3_ORYSJ|nr:hypothetical protein [Oryza sativa Japonica Group]
MTRGLRQTQSPTWPGTFGDVGPEGEVSALLLISPEGGLVKRVTLHATQYSTLFYPVCDQSQTGQIKAPVNLSLPFLPPMPPLLVYARRRRRCTALSFSTAKTTTVPLAHHTVTSTVQP